MCDLAERAPFERVLAIGAHPDDVELGAGGFLTRLARKGSRVVVSVLSVPSRVDERLGEARKGAELIGAELVDLSGGAPGRVEDVPMYRLVAKLDELVLAVRPHLVLTHANTDVHWDHHLVHQATLAALRRSSCNVLAFTSSPELGSAPISLGSCFADVTDTIETKLEALRAHASQVSRGAVKPAFCRDLARIVGRLCGVEYAEAFQVLRLTL